MSPPTATFDAPTRRDRTLNLDDPRIAESVRQIACAARASGHTVDVCERFGNAIRPVQVYVVAWVPWASEYARALKALGANDTAMDCCAAMVNDSDQSVTWYEPIPSTPALFRLVREVDATGVSGTGHVADGVLWHDGTCCVRWRTSTRSTAVYDSLADVEKIHGHDGRTRVEWERS